MGEQRKPEEEKAEEKKEEKAEEIPPAEAEEEKAASPFILSVDLHCIGCAKKIEKSVLRIRGVVGVKTDMVKNQVTIKGVVEPEAVCNKIMKKTKRSAKVLAGEPIPQVVASGLNTVELNVNMHCEACAEQLRRKILKMKGVSKVETELSSGKARVMGTMDGEKLVEYVYRRTKKQAKIVPQPEPEKAKEEEEEEAKAEEEKKAEKEDAKAKEEEEEKKEGGDGKKDNEGGGGEDDDEESISMQRTMYNYQYLQPVYVMERIPFPFPAPQLFSDENPNACSIC